MGSVHRAMLGHTELTIQMQARMDACLHCKLQGRARMQSVPGGAASPHAPAGAGAEMLQ